MSKNLFVSCMLLMLFCGCSTAVIYDSEVADELTQKNKNNAAEMAQIIGNKQDALVVLDFFELQKAMNEKYFLHLLLILQKVLIKLIKDKK